MKDSYMDPKGVLALISLCVQDHTIHKIKTRNKFPLYS